MNAVQNRFKMRGYPRFFISDVKNGNTPGRFIIHALDPFLVIKVYNGSYVDETENLRENFGNFTLELIKKDLANDIDQERIKKVFKRCGAWYIAQIDAERNEK